MRLYKIRIRSEYEVIVAAENIAEANQGKGIVGECVATGLNQEIVSTASYDDPALLRQMEQWR